MGELTYLKNTPIILSYTAGIIDGEGSIQIRRHRDKRWEKSYGKAYYTTWVVITVANTNPILINCMHRLFGGQTYKEYENHTKNKTKYLWHLAGKKCYPFLRNINTYLLLKVPQAKVALQFEHASTDKQRKQLFLKMKKLNKKGRIYAHRAELSAKTDAEISDGRLQTFIPSR